MRDEEVQYSLFHQEDFNLVRSLFNPVTGAKCAPRVEPSRYLDKVLQARRRRGGLPPLTNLTALFVRQCPYRAGRGTGTVRVVCPYFAPACGRSVYRSIAAEAVSAREIMNESVMPYVFEHSVDRSRVGWAWPAELT